MDQCTGQLEAHGRRWRCGRRAAKKHGGKLCGRCASLRPEVCCVDAFGRQRHSATCFTGEQVCPLVPTKSGVSL